jgi:hypothetical protein
MSGPWFYDPPARVEVHLYEDQRYRKAQVSGRCKKAFHQFDRYPFIIKKICHTNLHT